MSVVLILMACSILVAAGFLSAYLWSVKNGQYNDIEGDGLRILNDSEISNKQTNNKELSCRWNDFRTTTK